MLRKTFESGQLVYFDAHAFGVVEEPGDLLAIVVEPHNLLRNAKIRIQKTEKTYRRIPYFYLEPVED